MKELCDSDLIKFHVNGEHTFFINQRIVSKYSGKLKKMMNQENRGPQIEIDDFPGGTEAFELVSRFCYNNGRIEITPSNVSVLHCSATFLEMTEKLSSCNLLHQTETFLDGLFYWSWNDVLLSLKSCENFFSTAESSGLVHKLISSLLSRISQNSDSILSSSFSSSPESSGFRFSSSTNKTTPTSDFAKPGSPTKAWWFEDLTILGPKIVEKIIKTMGCFGTENHNLVLTKFLLHYLKTTSHTKSGNGYGSKLCSEYTGLADTAIHGVVLMGKTSFSCRGLFWVLRMVSALGLSKDCRDELERLIGGVLEKATLDDVLVSGHKGGGVYDVNLVLRLVKVFVSGGDGVSGQRMKKVGRLIDKYMGEIAPDQKLKVSKFLSVAESLPDSARDCFDGMYRAIDIYLESHQTLCFDDRSKLCRCLNYEKLTLEACKDLAKNPLIPPRIAIQALIAQKPKVMSSGSSSWSNPTEEEAETENTLSEYSEDSEEMKMNLAKMQWRVMELEKVCMEMKGQMSKMVKNKVMSTSPVLNRTLPRLC